jgi:hypothetical protein
VRIIIYLCLLLLSVYVDFETACAELLSKDLPPSEKDLKVVWQVRRHGLAFFLGTLPRYGLGIPEIFSCSVRNNHYAQHYYHRIHNNFILQCYPAGAVEYVIEALERLP